MRLGSEFKLSPNGSEFKLSPNVAIHCVFKIRFNLENLSLLLWMSIILQYRYTIRVQKIVSHHYSYGVKLFTTWKIA